MIHHVQERCSQRQCRGCGEAIGREGQCERESDEDETDVFDGAVGNRLMSFSIVAWRTPSTVIAPIDRTAIAHHHCGEPSRSMAMRMKP